MYVQLLLTIPIQKSSIHFVRNGILLANIVPQGSFLAGSSSVVQLDAWNWEDAAYKTDGGMHLYMPSLMPRPDFGRFGGGGGGRFGPQQAKSNLIL